MKKIMLIFAVFLFCWSCDVPGSVTDTDLNTMVSQSRTLYDNDEGEDDDPGDEDCEMEEVEEEGSSGGGYTRPSFPSPSTCPAYIQIQLFRHNYYQDPLTVEGIDDMIYAFSYHSYNGYTKTFPLNKTIHYRDVNYGLANLCKYNFNDVMSSIKVFNDTAYPIEVTLYEHANYDGKEFSFPVASEDSKSYVSLKRESLNWLTSWNDDVSSIKIKIKGIVIQNSFEF